MKRAAIPLLVVVTCLIACVFVSHRSFWIDEGGTAIRAMMPSLGDWWRMILHLRGSDIQMPAYMLYAWLWMQKLGATTEFWLRMSNLPWLLLAVLVLHRIRFWPVVCLASPFVLYFMDDFRPYVMQISAGACAAAALGRTIGSAEEKSLKGIHAVSAACLFLIACSLTGAIWAAGTGIAAAVVRPDWLTNRKAWLHAAPWLVAALAAAGFYGFTLTQGYRATEIRDAGVMNVLFGFYEMTGMLGLGPGRNEIRSNPSCVIAFLPVLVPAAACIAAAWGIGAVSWARNTPKRSIAAVCVAVALPLFLLTAVGILMDFRVLGRHLSPMIPAVLLPIAASFGASGRLAIPGRVTGFAAFLFMAGSALQLRFHHRHDKDDFRTATGLAIEALRDGRRVWWQADMNTARYYAFRAGGPQLVNFIQVLESDPPTSIMFADTVFINRPDLYFANGNHERLLTDNFFRKIRTFQGFEVWSSD
jgi:hypothetical protein